MGSFDSHASVGPVRNPSQSYSALVDALSADGFEVLTPTIYHASTGYLSRGYRYLAVLQERSTCVPCACHWIDMLVQPRRSFAEQQPNRC